MEEEEEKNTFNKLQITIKEMIENNELSPQGEENVKNFNKMFNNLNPNHFDRFTYLMAEAVVGKVELANELTKKLGDDERFVCGEPERNRENRLRDVQIWCRERLYRKAVEPRVEWL